MGVTNSNKLTDVSSIQCNGNFNVTLALSASPDIVNSPTDIVLMLDKSGNMAGVPFESLKAGARAFIDIIDESTDGTKDGTIGSGSAIGIVGFSSPLRKNHRLQHLSASLTSPWTTWSQADRQTIRRHLHLHSA